MTEREPEPVQLILEVLSDDAGLETRRQTLGVHLERAAHPFHIDDERVLPWEDAAADAAAGAIRDDRERTFGGNLDERRELFGRLGPSDERRRSDRGLASTCADLLARPKITRVGDSIARRARDICACERADELFAERLYPFWYRTKHLIALSYWVEVGYAG